MNRSNVLLRRAVLAALALSALPATAQEDEQSGESGRNIETIVVTAQKREQNLQDVPIVVTAVSEQLLQDTGVRDIKDLTLLAPGLTVTSSSSEASTTARIRGIGTVGDNPGLESSVGVVVDGVYRPRNGVGFGDLGQLERIEVLKGPQGTLFGKNTSAGVINIITKAPSSEFGSTVELSGGDYGVLEGSAYVTGPLSGAVAGSLYAAMRERDGFLDVRTGPDASRTETEDFDRNVYTARGQLLIQPSEPIDLRLIADYSERDENCCAAPQVVVGPTAGLLNFMEPGSVALQADPFDRLAFSDRKTDQDIEDKGVSAELNWDFAAFTLTSVSAWRDWEIVNAQDADFTTVDILYREPDGDNGTRFKQLSQEVRLAGETDRLNWLVGAFYAGEDLVSRVQLIPGGDWQEYVSRLATANTNPNLLAAFGATFPGGVGTRDVYDQESESWALFTNNSLQLTEALEFTLGLRYTNESKDLDARFFNAHNGAGCQALRNAAPAIRALLPAASQLAVFGLGCVGYNDPLFNDATFSQSIDENEWSGTAKLAWRFTDQVMSYASYARGYKASGFNLDRERLGTDVIPGSVVSIDTDTRFDKELVDSYELGLKTQWLADTLLLNGALFYQDYEDFQLNTFTGLQFEVTSLPRVVSEGVDVDVVWFTPLDQLSLQGGVTYAETEIRDFGAAITTFSPARENDRLSFAPKWSGSLSATFEQPVGAALLFRANVGAKYMSEYNTGSNLDPNKIQDSLTVVNARLGFGAEDESWMVEGWAQNLTDEDYYQVVFDATHQSGTLNGFLAAPRTYGVTARFKF